MENIMMLPASYCVMNEEEMTYTSGGANIVQDRKSTRLNSSHIL